TSIPQLERLKNEIGSKFIAEAAREAANLIEGSYYTAEEEREIKELLIGILNDQQDQSKTVPEIAHEAPLQGVETAQEKHLEPEVAGSHVELEKTVKSESPDKETPDEEKKGMENFLSTPIFPNQIKALNKLIDNHTRDEIIEAMGKTKGGEGGPFHRGTTYISLSKAVFKLRNRIEKNLASEEEIDLWRKMTDASPVKDKSKDISKNTVALLHTKMGIQPKAETVTPKGQSEATKTPSNKQADTEDGFPRFFKKDELQNLTEILVNAASKSNPLDPNQITRQLFEKQLASGEVSFHEAVVKMKKLLGSIKKLGNDKGLKVINYGTLKHPLYYGEIESRRERKTPFEAQKTPQLKNVEKKPQEEAEQPTEEKITNPYKSPEEITKNGTISRDIYQALYNDYPSKKGLRNVDIAQIIFAEELEKGTMDLTTAVNSVLDNGSVLFIRLKKTFGIKIENIGEIKPGKTRASVAYYRLPIIVTSENQKADASAQDLEEANTDPTATLESSTVSEKTSTQEAADTPTEAETTPEETLSPLVQLVPDVSSQVPSMQEQKPQLRSLVVMPERKAVMVDGHMKFFADTREAGRMMSIMKKISANPTNTWLASEFIERGQTLANVLENLRELKKFFTKNGFGEVLDIDGDGSEAIVSFVGKIRMKDPNGKKKGATR
ncbi:MAG: hypothetical protein Q7T54_03390, partial [Candidatus Levybacteria bacterium]|nr:hypothetical protein [Candidatus Levybacteria bacterium]